MTAIILAAGRGTRLGSVTAQRPKCLIPVGGRTVLAHALDRIARVGIRRVVVAVGFEADRVRRHVHERAPDGLAVQLAYNPRFAETNNLYSLAVALRQVDGPFTVINGDDLFHVRILAALQAAHGDAAASIDFHRPIPADAMKTIVEDDHIARIGKDLPDARAVANAIGLYRFSGAAAAHLRAEILDWVSRGWTQSFYVAAIDALVHRIPVRAVSTQGLTWCEIDDARDLAAAPGTFRQILAEEPAAVRPRDRSAVRSLLRQRTAALWHPPHDPAAVGERSTHALAAV